MYIDTTPGLYVQIPPRSRSRRWEVAKIPAITIRRTRTIDILDIFYKILVSAAGVEKCEGVCAGRPNRILTFIRKNGEETEPCSIKFGPLLAPWGCSVTHILRNIIYVKH